MANSAEVIARRLWEVGCRHAFGIPGGEVLALLDALDRRGIEVILTKHENAAGFMAEGVQHANRAPALLFATLGPGLANAVTVIATAMQDRVPMIVLVGSVPALERVTYTHQVFDHLKLVEPITKAAFRIEPGTAGAVIDKAIAIATEGRPGPVLIDVPTDLQVRDQGEMAEPRRSPPAPVAPAESESLKQARRWLKEAQRPLIIAGLDILHHDAAADLAALCQAWQAPVITTYKAKGVLPEDDPLALGGAGLSPRYDALLLPFLRSADCILLAGYDPIEMRIGWRDPWEEGTPVVELAAEPSHHGMHRAGIEFVCDLGAGLQALSEDLGSGPRWPGGEPAALQKELEECRRAKLDWGPAAIVEGLRESLPRETVVTVDSGAHRILLSQMMPFYEPRALLQSSALGTMGCAIPLAAGRKLAEPNRPVAAVLGDACLEMYLGELATLRDLGLSLPIVVFADRQLALIEMKQRRSQMNNLAVDFAATDFPAVAQALGGQGRWIDDRPTLRQALKAALAAPGFSLLACRIERAAYDELI